MKELIFRHYFNDVKNTNQIAESLAPIINETFDRAGEAYKNYMEQEYPI